MIGQIIDERYQIQAVLGRGAMGTVYQALDHFEKRSVALKTLHLYDAAPNDNALSRFNREFRVLTQMDHGGIVRAYDHGTYLDVPYLVMELIQGRTLKAVINDTPLPEGEILALARQICDALTHLHNNAVVHRDLKPGNIMVIGDAEAAQIKLMDFGLVRVTDLSLQLTQEGMTLGTVAYIAPEQAQGFPVDFRADLYSLGAILYEMATGRPPFVHENPVTVLMHQITTSPLNPRHFRPDLNEGLTQLILQLLAKDPSHRPANAAAVAAHLAHLNDESAPDIPSFQRADLIPRIPLVGRELLLDKFTEHWLKAQSGQGQIVLVSGIAGAGKTRFVTEMGQRIQTYQAKYMRGRCREHAALPYQPFVDMFENMFNRLPDHERQDLPSEILRIVPSLASEEDDTVPSNPTDARLRLFNTIWQMFLRKSKERPGMIVIEDIQWADPSTLDLLSFLAERIEQAPVLLSFTYRPEEALANGPLQTLLQKLNGLSAAHYLELDLLTQTQVGTVLQAALGQAHISDWVVEHFYQATDGNPLFLEETLKALAAEGHVTRWIEQDTSQWTTLQSMTLQLPKSVLSLAERRLQILSDEDRTMLTAAAVLGQEFTFTMLEAITRSDEDTLLDTVDRLLAAQLIIELPLQQGEDRYRFTQESLRQALLQGASQRRLRVMHRRAGEAIQSLYDTSRPQHWPALAYHFAQSGNEAQAVKYFTLAGDAAAKLYANMEAISHYTNALQLITNDTASQVDTEDLIHLYSQRGRHLELSTLHKEALENYREMEALADERQDRSLKLASLTSQATLRAIITPVHDIVEGQALSEQALALARELGDCPTETKILWILMHLYMNTGHTEQAIAYGEESIDIARRLDLHEQLAFSLNDIQSAYLITGQTEALWAASQESRDLWKTLNNKPMLSDNLTRAALYHYFCGNYEASLKFTTEGERISHEIGNLWGQTFSQWVKGYVWLEHGQWDKAIQVMETAIQQGQRSGMVVLEISARLHLAWLYAHVGYLPQALELAQMAHEKSKSAFPGWQHETGAILGRIHILNHDLAAAADALSYTEIQSDSKNINSFASFFVPVAQAEYALASNNYATAVERLDAYIALIRQTQTLTFLPEALCIKGHALIEQHKLDEAYTVLNEARSVAEMIGSKRNVGAILLQLRRIELLRGNSVAAETLRQKAQRLAQYIANQLPSPDLQTSFLQLPYIRAIFEEEPIVA